MQTIRNDPSTKSSAIISEGLRLGFRVNRQELLSRLPGLFLPGSVPTDFASLDFEYSLEAEHEPEHYGAYCGSQALARRASLEGAITSISSSVQHTVAQHSREHLFLHAGVIGWRGKAVLFPGGTCSGKSTLVRALIRAGAVYFSDEFARIDAQGLVHPFARPLSIRSSEGRIAVSAEQEGAEIAFEPCRAGAIVITHYRADGAWSPSRISRGQASLELLRNTVAVRSDPAKAIRYMSMLAGAATAIRSARGEAEANAPAILRTLDELMDWC